MLKLKLFAVAALSSFAAVCANASNAGAQSIIKNPGDHPRYSVEMEPHVNLGWANRGYAGSSAALGAGARFSIPIVHNGFISSINNSVAISFGLDYLRYGCNVRFVNTDYDCGASYLLFPVAMQWNFWLSPKFSVFGEPGLYIYHGFFDDICSGPGNQRFCTTPTQTSVDFMFHAGGRFHINDTVALTLRVGYPTLSFGVSFLL